MSKKFVRNLTDVKDIDKLAIHVRTQNDLIQTTDGTVYVVTKNGYEQITGGASDSDITSLKSENTKLKNRLSKLETSNETLKGQVETLETSNEDLISRIETLENADDTTSNDTEEQPTE